MSLLIAIVSLIKELRSIMGPNLQTHVVSYELWPAKSRTHPKPPVAQSGNQIASQPHRRPHRHFPQDRPRPGGIVISRMSRKKRETMIHDRGVCLHVGLAMGF